MDDVMPARILPIHPPRHTVITGGHSVPGVISPQPIWYFAEGYTGADFDEYLLVLNPGETATEVRITYYREHGNPIVKTFTAAAQSRSTIAVHLTDLGVGRNLAVSAKVESTTGVGIVVERALYFQYPYQGASLSGDADLIPPEHLIFVGTGDFIAIGQEFVEHFHDLAGLQPHEQVLDVGCGIGRIAVALTSYLSPAGRYEGFDILSVGIEWCTHHITPRFPNFQFQLADVYNAAYNPTGRLTASEFTFPYPTDTFDFACLTSVFTHLLPHDARHYLAEVARVLKPGGRCFATFFFLTPMSKRLIEQGRSTLSFTHTGDEYSTTDPHKPEQAIAFEEQHVRAWYTQCGLSIVEPIHYGHWSGRMTGRSQQDIIVAVKTKSSAT